MIDISGVIFNIGLLILGIMVLCISVYILASEITSTERIDKDDWNNFMDTLDFNSNGVNDNTREKEIKINVRRSD